MTSDDNEETKAAIEVHGAGSCLVDDFLGIGGLEQCLVLPQVLRDETSCMLLLSEETTFLALPCYKIRF